MSVVFSTPLLECNGGGESSMELTCTGCQQKLRIGEEAVGKRVRCPQCNQIQYVPVEQRTAAAAETWRLKGPRGDEYGPVDRAELDRWVNQGRVTATSQLMCSTSGRWVWAGDVYPVLRPASSTVPPVTGGSMAGGRLGAGQLNYYSDKSKIVAGVLGLFLGYFGIQRFYLGYPFIGILMLCTGGGCGVWSFIDSILILVGSVPDADGRPLRD